MYRYSRPREDDYYESYSTFDHHRRGQAHSTEEIAPQLIASSTAAGQSGGGEKRQMRYIDISSGNRNRQATGDSNCDFAVTVNAAMRLDGATALDPIIAAFPFECNFTSGASTLSNIRMNTSSIRVRNFYANSIIEIAGTFSKIAAYSETTQVATLATPLSAPLGPLVGTMYTIRKQLPSFRGLVTAITANTVTIGNGTDPTWGPPSASDGAYVGAYVFSPGTNPPQSYQFSLITGYNGTNNEIIVNGGTFWKHPPVPGDVVEILPFTRDNVVPLVFNSQSDAQGSDVPQGGTPPSRSPMYRVKLCDLVIPNMDISSGYGGRISDYPFLYVTISNDQGSTFSNLFFSNNPHASKAVFKVVMCEHHDIRPWLFFDGGDIEQVFRFNPDQNLRVRIWLPNGDTVSFDETSPSFFFPAYKFPIESDPFSQCTFTFGITKV